MISTLWGMAPLVAVSLAAAGLVVRDQVREARRVRRMLNTRGRGGRRG